MPLEFIPLLTVPPRSAVAEPDVAKEEKTDTAADVPWNVIAHNDPITKMNYVTMVFQKVFGYTKEKAETHMWEVHRNGRSVVCQACANARNSTCSNSTRTNSSPRWRKRSDIDEGAPSKGNSSTVVFEEIEPFFLGLLRRLPASADPLGDDAAKERLFGEPMPPSEDGDEFNSDWRAYVEPELRDLFKTARESVEEDLGKLPTTTENDPAKVLTGVLDSAAFAPSTQTFEIPPRHLEAWLSVLNQARLVIAARRNFGEKEMDEDLPFPPFSERDLDLFRIHFYDFSNR